MPYLDVDGESLFFEHFERGAPRSLLLVHGAGGDASHWPAELKGISEANVYVLELPGHGRSGGSGRDTVDAYATVVVRWTQRLGLSRVVLAGHSLGGAIAQAVALTRTPWLEALVLVGTGARLKVLPELIEQLPTDFAAVIDATCQSLFGPGVDPALVAAERQRYLTVDWRVLRGDFLACNRFDVMTRLGDIRVPTLIITGSADLLTPAKYAQYLHERIAGSTLTWVPHAGHMVGKENPVDFVQAITAYLNNLPAAAPSPR